MGILLFIDLNETLVIPRLCNALGIQFACERLAAGQLRAACRALEVDRGRRGKKTPFVIALAALVVLYLTRHHFSAHRLLGQVAFGLIFGGIIVGLTGEFGDNFGGFWVLALVGFIFYMAIDSLKVAKAKQTGETITDPLASWTRNKATGPYILIGIGVLFLLNNFNVFDYFQIRRLFWPVVLIGVGFLMLRNRISHD